MTAQRPSERYPRPFILLVPILMVCAVGSASAAVGDGATAPAAFSPSGAVRRVDSVPAPTSNPQTSRPVAGDTIAAAAAPTIAFAPTRAANPPADLGIAAPGVGDSAGVADTAGLGDSAGPGPGPGVPSADDAPLPWWGWVLLLFGLSLAIGVVAVIGGVGGGVLFVPIVGSFFPFHIDYVRGAGLLVALCGSLSAAPTLLKSNLASVRLAAPMALAATVGSIAGATVGLAMQGNSVQLVLGIVIISVAGLIAVMRTAEAAGGHTATDGVARALRIGGVASLDGSSDAPWAARRTWIGATLFIGVGFLAGMLGLGAGWASVPVLHLVMGVPLKIAVASTAIIIVINSATASWVYFAHGSVLPLMAIPAVAGMMIGTRIGARLLPKMKASAVRWVVLVLLTVAGVTTLVKGVAG